jgi:adenylate kinase
MVIVLVGAPGAGKGTQATLIASSRGLRHVSTGDLLREAVEEGSGLGLKAAAYLDDGQLVPDDVMLGLIGAVLEEPRCGRGIVLDGFPRTVPQAEGLGRMLEERGRRVNCVIHLDIDVDEAVKRLASRVWCPRCAAIHNLATSPPKIDGVCDACGGKLEARSDDSAATVQARFKAYRRLTEPLIGYYGERGLLRTIAAGRAIEEVERDVSAAIDGGCAG